MAGISFTTSAFCRAHWALASASGTNGANFPAPMFCIFGVPVTERTLHSVCTLSIEAGLHPGRLRKTMRAAGLIDDRQMALRDNLVLFSAPRAA